MQPKVQRYNKNIKLKPIKEKENLESSITSINSNNSTKTEIDFKKSKTKFNSTSEKFEIDLNETDKKADNDFMNNLSDNERNFYKNKAKELYDFLNSIYLVRFIESFIKEVKKIENNEIGVECDINNNNYILNRCWTCFNKLNEKNLIEKTYSDSIVTRKVRFCCKSCMEKFEKNIYVYCDYCNIIFDKSKGDFVFEKYHFHSKECLDKYIEEHNEINYNKLSNIQEDDNYYNIDENKPYDPMEDF